MPNRLRAFFRKALGLPGNITGVQALQPAPRLNQPPNSIFTSGTPISPSVINAPDESGRIPARIYDFPIMVNIRYRPDAERMTAYSVLRWLSDNHLVTRAAINVRKKEIVGLDWDIVTSEKGAKADPVNKALLKTFWRKPDGFTPFSQWLNNALEDLFVLDALTLEKRKLRNGQLTGLDVIDGATIKILLDDTGRLPAPPYPAYQQVLKGFPRSNFTRDELIYDPYNNTPDSPYGTSFMEAAQLEINAMLRLMSFTLNYFTEGNTPEGFLDISVENSAPETIAQMQWMFDALLAGNEAERRKIRIIPKGSTYQPVKNVDFSQFVELDMFLTKKVLMAYEVQPHEVGLTENVNKSVGETQENITYRRAIKPLIGYLEDIFTDIIEFDFGIKDLRFKFSGYETEDNLLKAQTHQILINTGLKSIDEIRMDEGLDPLGVGQFYALGGQLLYLPDLQRGSKEGAPPAPVPSPFFGRGMEAAEKDLGKWEKKALADKELGRAPRPFVSDVIPSNLLDEIDEQLAACIDGLAVKALFASVKKKLQPTSSGNGQSPSLTKTSTAYKASLPTGLKSGGKISFNPLTFQNPY